MSSNAEKDNKIVDLLMEFITDFDTCDDYDCDSCGFNKYCEKIITLVADLYREV